MRNIDNFVRLKISWFAAFFLLLILFPGLLPAQNRTRTDKLMDKARDAFLKRNYQEALVMAKKALISDQSDTQAALLMAEVYHELDSVQMELSCLEMALERGNSQPLLLFRLGEAYYKTGSYEAASSCLERYLNHASPGNVRTRAEKLAAHSDFAASSVKIQPLNPITLDRMSTAATMNIGQPDSRRKHAGFTRLLPVNGMRKQEDFYFSRSDSSG